MADCARAGNVTVRASISPGAIASGESANLTLTVDGKFRGAKPHIPDIDGLEIYSSGSSQSMQWINGRMSSSISYTFTVTASRKGTFRITPITVSVGNREYTANGVVLEVTAARSGIGAPPPASPSPRGNTNPATSNTPNPSVAAGQSNHLFIRSDVDRDTVFVNEQVTWTLGYYTDGRVRLLRSPNFTPPESQGFWVEDLPPQRQYNTAIDGRTYQVNEIRRAYFPTAPGVYTIGAAHVDVVVDDFTRRNRIDDFFSRGFNGGLGGAQHTLSTKPVTIVVRPVPPEGRPSGFAGAVASRLAVSMSVDKPRVKVGEPVNLTITLSGSGNMKTVPAPAITNLKAFKIYESGSKSDTFKKNYVVSGRKQVQYVIVPRNEGDWTIPAARVAYFDPVEQQYRVARSLPVTLHVAPGTNEDSRRVIYAGGGDDFEVINRDIRYIHPVPESIALSATNRWTWSRAAAGATALPLLALGTALWIDRRRRKLSDNAAWARSSRACKRATAGLRRARAELRDGGPGAATDRAAEAWNGYFADRMDVPDAGLTGESAIRWVESHGATALAARVGDLFTQFDAARFGAIGMDATGAENLIAAADEVIRACEREVPR